MHSTSPGSFPVPLLRFLERFHRSEFWESHEVLEGPWRESRSGFYHGLILYASAFVHVQRKNPRGVAAQLRKAERALGPYAPVYLGVDVAGLRAEAARLRRRVEPAAERGGPWEEPVAAPRIELDRSRLLGTEPELRED